MDQFDRLALLAELDHEICRLNHGRTETKALHKAHDYLAVPFGDTTKNGKNEAAQELVIPVCLECIEALQGEEWTLLFCIECGESRWVFREAAKNNYRHHVLWLKGCPECANELGGLYFNDPDENTDAHLLVINKLRCAA
jgi:hypothetical protein